MQHGQLGRSPLFLFPFLVVVDETLEDLHQPHELGPGIATPRPELSHHGLDVLGALVGLVHQSLGEGVTVVDDLLNKPVHVSFSYLAGLDDDEIEDKRDQLSKDME